MRILFYSKTCGFCIKLLEYIDKNNLGMYFKLLCIDSTNDIPKNITMVPTIISEDIEAPLEGKKAFEYVINQKYFNHPTNNFEYLKVGVPKPQIEEDKMANTIKSKNGFLYVDKEVEKRFSEKEDNNRFDNAFSNTSDPKLNSLITERNMQDKKMQALFRLRK